MCFDLTLGELTRRIDALVVPFLGTNLLLLDDHCVCQVSSTMLLIIPDFSREFAVNNDVSEEGTGAFLTQPKRGCTSQDGLDIVPVFQPTFFQVSVSLYIYSHHERLLPSPVVSAAFAVHICG